MDGIAFGSRAIWGWASTVYNWLFLDEEPFPWAQSGFFTLEPGLVPGPGLGPCLSDVFCTQLLTLTLDWNLVFLLLAQQGALFYKPHPTQ